MLLYHDNDKRRVSRVFVCLTLYGDSGTSSIGKDKKAGAGEMVRLLVVPFSVAAHIKSNLKAGLGLVHLRLLAKSLQLFDFGCVDQAQKRF